MALVMTIRGFSQAAGAPAPIPTTYSKGQLLTEQRVMQAYITDANFHIDRGIKAVGASLPDSAKVSLLRATSRVAQVDETMKAHPERIEHLAFSLLYTREGMRKELRASYAKLRDEFGAVEDAMYALRRDMLRKGFFGEALKGQVAVLDAVSKLLPEIQQNDQALAGRIRGVVEEINKALAADDLAKAEELITQLRDMLEAAGHKQDIQKAKDKINETATGGGEGMSPTATQALEGGGSLTPAAGGVTVTGKDGQMSTIPGAVSIGAGKLRLADGTEVDLNGSKVQPDGSILLADGRVIKGTKVAAAAGMAGPVTPPKGAMLVDAEGNEILDEYVWENGEGKGVDKIYVGGKGMRLTRETKVTVRATLNAGKANTYAVAKTPGESRTWALVIAPVAGSEKKATGHLTLALALSDRNGGTGFTVNKWDISSPAGAPSMGEGSGPQVTATFDASATYAIQVTGTTDWGSPFVIKASLPVGVE
jgi:hypothetical protein